MAKDITSDSIAQAMTNAFDKHIRDALRERILTIMEPDINAAIDAAIKTFETSVRAYRDSMMDSEVLNILIRKI